MKKFMAIMLVLLIGLLAGAASATEISLTGPVKYQRTTGGPNIFNDYFSAIASDGKIIIRNGEANGDNRVSSAVVMLNGKQILGPNDFKRQVYDIQIPIALTKNNSLSVDLRSKPDSYLTIQVTQECQVIGLWRRTDAETSKGKEYLPNGQGYRGGFNSGKFTQSRPFTWFISNNIILEDYPASGSTPAEIIHETISASTAKTMTQVRQEDGRARSWARPAYPDGLLGVWQRTESTLQSNGKEYLADGKGYTGTFNGGSFTRGRLFIWFESMNVIIEELTAYASTPAETRHEEIRELTADRMTQLRLEDGRSRNWARPKKSNLSGWWDLYVPAISNKKIDAYYFINNCNSLFGTTLLNKPLAGNINGSDIHLDSGKGEIINGTLSGNTLQVLFYNPEYGMFDASLVQSKFHFTNFYPGEALNTTSPQFSWTADPLAEKYYILVMNDSAESNCNETSSCSHVWSMDGITGTTINFNANGTASQPLIPGNTYRVRVYSRYNNQQGMPVWDNSSTFIDTTMDVAFKVACNAANINGWWSLATPGHDASIHISQTCNTFSFSIIDNTDPRIREGFGTINGSVMKLSWAEPYYNNTNTVTGTVNGNIITWTGVSTQDGSTWAGQLNRPLPACTNASLFGDWIAQWGDRANYFSANGNGTVTDFSAFNMLSPPGAYQVSLDGSFSMFLGSTKGEVFTVTGMFTNSASGMVSVNPPSGPLSGTFNKVKDLSLFQGNYSGTISKSGSTYAISFSVNSSGVISNFSSSIPGGTSASGRALAVGNSAVIMIRTNITTQPYDQIVAWGTLVNGQFTGSFENNSGPSLGTISLNKYLPPSQNFQLVTQHYYLSEYFVAVTYPNTGINSISIAGPNISSWWNSGHIVAALSSRPTIGDKYVINVTYSNSASEIKELLVKGVNDQFAWLTYPENNSTITTTIPTFAWGQTTNAYRYMIGVAELIGTSENFLWWASAPAGTNALAYNSNGSATAPLAAGKTYKVYLHSYDADGNQSTTRSSFTID